MSTKVWWDRRHEALSGGWCGDATTAAPPRRRQALDRETPQSSPRSRAWLRRFATELGIRSRPSVESLSARKLRLRRSWALPETAVVS